MQMLERVRRCRFCKSNMTDTTSATSYMQNPFCDGCFDKRIERANERFGPRTWKRAGRYFESIQVSETAPTNDDSPGRE